MSKMLDNQGNTLVNVTTSALPAGAATGAKQDTGNTSLGSIDTKLSSQATATKQDTGNTSLASIDGKITAVNTGAVVVSSSALPSGAATAAKQPALGTAGTPSADVITVQGKAAMTPLLVDGSGVTQPISAASLPLPTSAATSTKQSDGSQKTQIVDGSGNVIGATSNALDVNIKSGAGSGGTALADNAAFTPGTTNFTPIGGEVDDTGTTAATENSAAAVRMTTKRAIHVNLRDNSGNELTVGGGTQYDEDTASTAADKITMAGVVRKDTAATLVDTDGDRTQLQVDANGRLHVNGSGVTQPVSGTVTANIGTSGSLALDATVGTTNTEIGATNETAAASDTATSGLNGRLQRIAQRLTSLIGLFPSALVGGRLDVNIGAAPATLTVASHAVTNAGTFAVQSAAAGDVANDGVDSGNPVKVGAQARSTEPTAVADADRVNLIASLLGKQVVLPFAIPASTWNYAAAAGGLVNTTGVTAKAAAGAGIRNYVTRAQVINSHQTIGTEVLIRDGAAGTVLHRGWAQPAGGGYTVVFDPPLRGTANTLIEIGEVTATATAGVLVNLQGYVAAE